MNLVIIGTGHIALVTGICLAEIGNKLFSDRHIQSQGLETFCRADLNLRARTRKNIFMKFKRKTASPYC